MNSYHIHLVSDSTGETVSLVSRACLVQFDGIETTEHIWSMIRNQKLVEEALEGIGANRGFVLYTLVDPELRNILEEGCRALKVPCIPVLDPVVAALGAYLGAEIDAKPGRQHALDAEYFSRIEALHFVLSHDDGQLTHSLDQADVIVLGVSRTSKTPTCIYLANRGIKAANIPIVPGCALPPELPDLKKPLIVGLTKDPDRLVQIRRNRLRMLNQDVETDYIDLPTVKEEVADARKLFNKYSWPMIDVTRKSVEEIAATILQQYNRRQEGLA
ncbi:MAG: kinase/pyrophosphorylase [Rhodospirillales bacterium]|nr:kinase/pyrophosphorylase [Rhodospirillales bacterium]